jgi:hypothetical protein
LLERAGWTADRLIATDQTEAELTRRGFELTAPARAFLARFGALQVSEPSPSLTCFGTDPLKALESIELSELKAAEQRVGAALSPIGDIADGLMAMLMDEHGRVFGFELISGDLFVLAKSGTEVLNQLSTGLDFRPVTGNDHWERRDRPLPPARTPEQLGDDVIPGQRERVLAGLHQIGWDFDRPRSRPETVGTNAAFPVPPRVRDFLERYHGLDRRGFSRWQHSTIIMMVSPDDAADRLSVDELRRAEELVGARLCPIGHYGYGQSIVLMDEHGRSFAIDDQSGALSIVAENEVDLLDFLLLGRGSGVWPVTEEEHWTNWSRTGA